MNSKKNNIPKKDRRYKAMDRISKKWRPCRVLIWWHLKAKKNVLIEYLDTHEKTVRPFRGLRRIV